jgi:multiple sugar transport system ATP-binding protein
MGRAIVRQPQVFCMDEPLSNLDAKLRVSTRTQIADLQRRLGVTTVYVTHDQVEAMTMGDRVAVLKDGVLQQVGSPLEVYDRPANLFVAGFIGSPAMNLLEAAAVDGSARIGGYEVAIDRVAAAAASGSITIGVRPEAWRIAPEGAGLAVRVTVVEELGSDAYVYGMSQVDGRNQQMIVRLDGRTGHEKGQTLWVTTDPQHVHVFDTASGRRLSQ